MKRQRPFLVRSSRREVSLAWLANARPEALRLLYQEMFGCEIPAGNMQHARRRIAWQIQADKEGGIPESARQHALAIARNSAGRVRMPHSNPVGGPSASSRLPSDHDSRIPMPGSVLVRDYRGRRILVRVLASGFEWEGRQFPSLSALAREITGTKWNGLLFFGLTKGAVRGRQA